jgi:DNA-binding CsgD family transcriptional regulator
MAKARSAPGGASAGRSKDEAEILELIHRNRIAVWTHDFESYQTCFAHADYITRWNASRSGGIFRRRGWDDISARLRKQFEIEAYLSERNAYETTVENLQLRVNGDMAWATFDQLYPSSPHSIYDTGGVSHEVRVFERQDGRWLIVFWGVMHGSVVSDHLPILHVSADGDVLWRSPAAASVLEADDDLTIRNGKVRFRDAKVNEKLQAALRWAAARDTYLLPRRGTLPIVVDAGEGSAMKVYWVVAEGGLIVLTLSTPGIDEDRLNIATEIFGLSDSQKQLAAHVANGLSLNEIAEKMGITANTARTHLDRVYDKVGVRTQPALVRVLLSTAAPV